jgi:hypothetical protein
VNPRSSGRWAILRLALIGAAILILAAAPAVFAKDAPGNNGTVKIHDGFTEADPVTQNEPHVGCGFHMHFMFGDTDQTGTWDIRSWPPTGDGTVVLSGTYDATGDGEDRRDATLTSGHYKLSWAGDTDKHAKQKTFWVDCVDGGGGGGGGIGGIG